MKKKVDKFFILVELLRKKALTKSVFYELGAQAMDFLGLDFDNESIENWQALGLDLALKDDKIVLNTALRPLNEQSFCVVDIESTGSIRSGQIIEIGAIKLKNGEQTAQFSSLIYANNVPEVITELTGIDASMLADAPSLASVISAFRDFLGRDIFVAHNVAFDYGFISSTLVSLGHAPLLNRRLCTVELARRVIESQRYNLGALKELLGISNTHHRAFSDAISAGEILKYSLKNISEPLCNSEDLIHFSKNAPRRDLPKNSENLFDNLA